MEKYCFYCHKPGHTKQVCPKLNNRRAKTCHTCGSPEPLFRECPKRATVSVGYQRPGIDHVERPIVEEHQKRITRCTYKSKPSTITVGDFIQTIPSSTAIADHTAVSTRSMTINQVVV
ncbi:hypothetical protein G6F62_010906 [Rhizopus arrhizus]|uniref:CCHC-type domain-containing protein n=1 Tax=Rhizopus oryzae TaxID=64495 RepID=A0A9P6WXE9_RHIOR|nr:hypothetical protein G6F23_011317 [Rhizopus arrhizus]KAG0753930.1 hypothetical protein G6F24_012714 [Rhizopus arrhizus]KAG0778670.1 hypothetical protein G6F22_011100 [Rhizopus arrhizus]KAG0779956.1 hypothetical protein G6F21_012357 [Rhizopus arrhizus]KAG0804746.1 hypothetical protein G6F20_012457 [Rhizopus arrhizus]